MTFASFNLAGKRIWVAGHNGMVGSALVRRLAREDCTILTVGRSELDLLRQAEVEAWIADQRPDAVFMAAAKVGGILANDASPADFLYENVTLATNIVHGSYKAGVRRLLFLGSSCVYPKLAPQPIPEDALLTGPLEPTNEAYAIAKIAGLKLCQFYRRQHGAHFFSAMPTNLYGPHDNFELQGSHVVPALMRKAHEAKLSGQSSFVVWGSGQPRREFLYVDDCADALVFLMKSDITADLVNVGSGTDITIADLAGIIATVVGFSGDVVFERSKPDGTPRKLMSSDRIRAIGWSPQWTLESGLRETYRWFLEQGPDPGQAARRLRHQSGLVERTDA